MVVVAAGVGVWWYLRKKRTQQGELHFNTIDIDDSSVN